GDRSTSGDGCPSGRSLSRLPSTLLTVDGAPGSLRSRDGGDRVEVNDPLGGEAVLVEAETLQQCGTAGDLALVELPEGTAVLAGANVRDQRLDPGCRAVDFSRRYRLLEDRRGFFGVLDGVVEALQQRAGVAVDQVGVGIDELLAGHERGAVQV